MSTRVPSHEDPDGEQVWPALPLEAWRDTQETLHMWTQIVGKIRMAYTPLINHWWNVSLSVTPRGLTTSKIPYGSRAFEMRFDFIDHLLHIETSRGTRESIALEPRDVADFYEEVTETMDDLGMPVEIRPVPDEVSAPVPFPEDRRHRAYDADYANRFWRVLLQVDRIFAQFRREYVGKSSPSHFFWGSFDMAISRFSGRAAPEHPGVPGVPDFITQESYCEELSSCGFWPGGDEAEEPVFYAYTYPEPDAYSEWDVRPEAAYYHEDLSEHLLPYDAVRDADDPDALVMSFLESTYDAAAELGKWNRAELERSRSYH